MCLDSSNISIHLGLFLEQAILAILSEFHPYVLKFIPIFDQVFQFYKNYHCKLLFYQCIGAACVVQDVHVMEQLKPLCMAWWVRASVI